VSFDLGKNEQFPKLTLLTVRATLVTAANKSAWLISLANYCRGSH